jgi:hypothetical protein
MSDVVGRIVDLQHLTMIYLVTSYADSIPLSICEVPIHVAFVLSLEEAPKNVVLQFRYECIECRIALVLTDK